MEKKFTTQEDKQNTCESNDQTTIENLLKGNGHLSNAFKLMAKRPAALSSFMCYRNNILSDGPLSEKERFLIALAVTVALKSQNCITNQANNAMKAGATEDEITQTALIAGIVSGNSPLNVAQVALSGE